MADHQRHPGEGQTYEEMDKALDEELMGLNTPEGEDEPAPDDPPEEDLPDSEQEDSPEPEADPDSEVEDPEPEADPEPEKQNQEMQDLQRELETSGQRVRDGQRKISEQGAQISTLMGEVSALKAVFAKQQAPEKEIPSKPKTPKEVLELQEEYPEIASGVQAMLNPIAEENARLQARLGEVNNKTTKMSVNADALARNQAISALLEVHPDAVKLAATNDFQEWIGHHPLGNVYQQAVFTDEGIMETNRAAHILSEFKNARGGDESAPQTPLVNKAKKIANPPPKNKARDPNYTPKNKRPLFTMADINKMSDVDFAKNEAQIDKAMIEGLIRY